MAGIKVLGLFLSAAVGLSPEPLDDAALAEQAAAAFQEGMRRRDDPDQVQPHFLRAAECYEILRNRGVSSPGLYRNQGNAYLLAGDLPRAVLAYRRGLRLAPEDGVLRANLAHAREQVAYPPMSTLGRPAADAWPPWLTRGLRWGSAGLAALLYGLGWLSLTRWLMMRRGLLLQAGIGAFAVALLAAVVPASGWVYGQWRDWQETRYPLVVVADDDVLLQKGNGPSYAPAYDTPVNRGVEARLLFARGDWLQIELSGGEVGWVRREAVLLDDPSH